MRARTSRVALALAVAALGASALAVQGASADHGGDSLTWIAQGGFGGDSKPVLENFNVRTTLFDVKRFGTTDGAARAGYKKYAAWGVVEGPDGGTLSLSRSENGTHWDTPIRNVIKNPDGTTVPFLLNNAYADVAFKNAPLRPQSFDDYPFAIYWRAGNPEDGFSTIHRAVSLDGITWEAETPVVQNSDIPAPLGGGGTPMLGAPHAQSHTYGPTDVIYQPSGSSSTNCGAASPGAVSVWNCRWVMVYDAVDSEHNLRVGGSADGFRWFGTASTILSGGGPGTWDDTGVTLGHLRKVGATWVLYYSGGDTAANACYGGLAACWSTGAATSPDGLTFTKASNNPVIPRQLLDPFGPDAPATLWNAQAVNDASDNGKGHNRVYFTRISNGSPAQRDMFMAYTSPAPSAGPQIVIDQPVGPYRNRADTPISFYVTDTIGTNIGVDMNTLVVKIDGVPISGWSVESPHIVGALKFPSKRITIPSGQNLLSDGLRTFSVSVSDLDGVNSVASTSFIVDTTAPTTTITTAPADGRIGFPISHPGTFAGTTIEPIDGTDLDRLDVYVTNPLGQERIYQVQIQPEFVVSSKEWNWVWHAPTPDLHFALPGPYTFEFRAGDLAQNRETSTGANTKTIIII